MRASSLMVMVAVAAALSLPPAAAMAAGFEVPENTTESLARGGTGVALKRDPSALYFNPALLPRADGLQILLDVNLVNLDVDFQRAPLTLEYPSGATEEVSFDPVQNQRGFFPAPFFALSTDLGLKNFTLAVGAFGPSAYGSRCYGQIDEGGECVSPDVAGADESGSPSAARHMLLSSDLLQAYLTFGVGYSFEALGGELSLGLAAAAAWQQNTFRVVVDAAIPPRSRPPYPENPSEEATFTGRDLTGWAPTGIVGLAYRRGGVTLGLSYRPPIRWEAEGTMDLEFPALLQETVDARVVPREGDEDDPVPVRLALWQAGSLRLGVGWESDRRHPGFVDRPRYTLEANYVFEDWSRTDAFEVTVDGEVRTSIEGLDVELSPIRQVKNWRDASSMRLGGSWGALPWLTASAGGYIETAAQSLAYTNVDFLSWTRYGLGFGASFHVTDWLDLKLGYAHVFMPDRTVTNGEIRNEIPLSPCADPASAPPEAGCSPSRPVGNVQNNGQWSASFQTLSAGLTFHFFDEDAPRPAPTTPDAADAR